MKTPRAFALLVVLLLLAAALAGCASDDTTPVRFIEYTDPESPYCIEMQPIVERLHAEYEPKIQAFDIVDVTSKDGAPQAEKAGVFVTPTFVLTDGDGVEIDRVIGATTEADLRARLDEAIAAANE